MRHLPLLLVASLALATPRAARAQASAAEALFDQGRMALAVGDLETACARFRASDEIEPAAGTSANLADCEERRGRLATAWAAYKSALARLPAGDSRAPILKERITKLEARLPKLVLALAAGAPKETVVREGDATLGASATYGVPLPLDPGVHHMLVTAPGRISKKLDVTLAETETTNVAVDVGRPADQPSETSPNTAREDASPSADGRSPGPWIVGGIGVAGLVVGAVTGGLVLSNKSVANAHCANGPPPTCRDQTGLDAASTVRTLGPVTTVALVIGAAGVTAGGVWFGARGPGASSAKVGMAATPGGASWRLEASW